MLYNNQNIVFTKNKIKGKIIIELGRTFILNNEKGYDGSKPNMFKHQTQYKNSWCLGINKEDTQEATKHYHIKPCEEQTIKNTGKEFNFKI